MNAFELEEISINHWPALSTMLYDGWVLRFSEGYTKRANSISPLYASTLDLEQKIKVCEELYARRGLPAVYKLTPFAQPAHLDGLLEKMGYAMSDTISVQTLDLDRVTEEPWNRSAEISESFTADWLDAYGALSGVLPEHRSVLERMLANIQTPAACVSLRLDGRVAACGMGVLERNTLGVFCIVTDPDYRNRGLGGQLMLHLLRWGNERGETQLPAGGNGQCAGLEAVRQAGLPRGVQVLVPRQKGVAAGAAPSGSATCTSAQLQPRYS